MVDAVQERQDLDDRGGTERIHAEVRLGAHHGQKRLAAVGERRHAVAESLFRIGNDATGYLVGVGDDLRVRRIEPGEVVVDGSHTGILPVAAAARQDGG
jgi:hypothetical protein